MLHRLAPTSDESESGQALVEFALVLPVLLLLLLGILDLSKAYNYWNDSTRLASATARYAAVQSLPPSSSITSVADLQALAQYMHDQADSPELRSKVRVCITVPASVGQAVQVTVKSTYKFVPYLKLTDKVITGSADMRLEALPKFTGPATACYPA